MEPEVRELGPEKPGKRGVRGYFFTWNLVKTSDRLKAFEAFDLAILHLAEEAKSGPCFAALQEVPKGITSEQVVDKSKDHLRVVGTTLGQKVVLIHSRDVQVERARSFERMAGAHIRGDVLWGGIQVLGVHLDNRLTEPSGQKRGVEAASWQARFLEFWTGGPLVVLGDFNADPYHSEICARAGGFFALRDRDEIEPRRSDHISRLPLYNPMWDHLSEATEGRRPRGTHHYDKSGEGIGFWLYDQILVSPGLANHLLGRPIILNQLGGTSLVTKRDGRSRGGRPNVSDHLPVCLTIDLEGASPWRM